MSRFVEILHAHKNMINMKDFPGILREMKEKLNAESAHMEVRFPYFIRKDAPVSGTPGYLEYTCAFIGHMDEPERHERLHRLRVGPRHHALPLLEGDKRLRGAQPEGRGDGGGASSSGSSG